MKNEDILKQSDVICKALSSDEDNLKRDILSHTGNRWAMSALHVLAVNGVLRHAELARLLAGVTQRMLTRTLRQLERDGLVGRFDYQEKSPRVEYAITSLGTEFLIETFPLWNWVINNSDAFRIARERYDNR